VFLTAKVQPADVTRLRELGAVGVIGKPFDPMGLPGELARLLGAS
jgi:CheY-like chemotaxis protein